MAQTFVNTGTQASNIDGLKRDFLSDVNYKRTVFLSMCGKTKAIATLHKWTEDTLAASSTAHTRAEGWKGTHASGDNTIRAQRTNECEITGLLLSSSGSQDAVDKAGLGQGSEYDHQLERRTKELAKDMNKTLWQQTAQTRVADSATAGQLTGYFAASTISTIDAGTALLTDDLYNQLCQTLVEAGVDPDVTFCAGFNKGQISSWAQPNRRYESEDKKMTVAVNVFDGDWGIQKIFFDLDVPTTKIAVTQMDLCRVAQLRPFEHKVFGVEGDVKEGHVLAEYTFEYGAQKALGSITNLGVGA